jgi:hypothetical protein
MEVNVNRISANLAFQDNLFNRLGGQKPTDEIKAKQAAKEFAGMFLHQFLEISQGEVDPENPFQAGGNEAIFRSMYNAEIAKQAADKFMPDLVNKIYKDISAKNAYKNQQTTNLKEQQI